MKFDWKDSYIGNKYVLKSAILIPIFLNKHTFYIQLDTGTKKSVIYKEFLSSQNINPLQSNNIEIEIKIDKVSHNINFKIDTESKIYYYKETPVIGLLGLDFVMKNNLFIDFPKQIFEFNNKNTLIKQTNHTSIPFKIINGFIAFNSKIDERNYHFMWDSGASFIDLFTNTGLWQELTLKNLENPNNELINVSGAFGTEHILIKNKIKKKFKLLDCQMQSKAIYCSKVYSQLTDLSVVNIDGLFGNTLLFDKRMYFDFKINMLTIINCN